MENVILAFTCRIKQTNHKWSLMMNTKQIILTSALLGFTIPSFAAVSAVALSAKKYDLAGPVTTQAQQETQKNSFHTAGCGCPFCQKPPKENISS